MDKSKSSIFILLTGGIATGICFLFMQFYLAWFCYIPLFYYLEKANTKRAFFYFWLYGVISSSILYYWIVPVTINYSGDLTLYSVFFYCAAVTYFSLYLAIFGIIYSLLQRRSGGLIAIGISVSVVYVLLDVIKIHVFRGLPWLHYNLAITQAQNKVFIQWASVGGLYIIIFFIVFFNYLLTQYLIRKEKILLKAAVGVIAIFLLGSFFLNVTNNRIKDNEYNTVLINENIKAETRWNDSTGDSLANVFFRLNKDASKFNPDLIIWSETAIPWKFESDDEFIPRILSITYKSKADHLLGIFSPALNNDNHVYNSACLIKYNGRITGKYDKTILLDFLEKPFNNALISALPFINNKRYDKIIPGTIQKVIKNGRAVIGVLICNESLCEDMYAAYIKDRANLLVVMSNDAWFENTPLQMHHFYTTRIEAVMMGRDVVVNSNRGIAGIIRADGRIEVLPHSDNARILNCRAHLLSNRTVYSSIRNFTIPFYLLIIFFSIISRRNRDED